MSYTLYRKNFFSTVTAAGLILVVSGCVAPPPTGAACKTSTNRTSFDVSGTFNTTSAQYVDPFIGSAAVGHNAGNTFPGAVAPWGMVSVSPHNKVTSALESLTATDNGNPIFASGYKDGNRCSSINGFGYTHLSGTGCPDLGAPVIMATVGAIKPKAADRQSFYANETAHAGYYGVDLLDSGVRAEATATTRVGVNRFTFPLTGTDNNVLIDAANNLSWENPNGHVSIISNTEVEGWSQTGKFCNENNSQKIYFVARFNRPAVENGTWSGTSVSSTTTQRTGNVGAYFSFDSSTEASVEVAVGISYVSAANARQNLNQELGSQDFSQVLAATVNEWDQNLSRLNVSGNAANPQLDNQKTTFYTALYHSLLHPSVFSDVNGQYRAMNGTTATANNYTHYDVFSLWDSYRTVHPLLTLVYPERQVDMLQSLADKTTQNGGIPPQWSLAGSAVDVMVGSPASIVVADSYLKGLTTGYDVTTLYNGMKNAVAHRPGNSNYQNLGYIPMEDAANCHLAFFPCTVWGPVSTTLEYSYADWSISQMANALGNTADAATFSAHADAYAHFYDANTGLLRPKNADGNFYTPFDAFATRGSSPWKNGGGPGYVEGSAWNYAFFVPHDIQGLAALHGGDANFLQNLNTIFNNGQFAIWNEPDIAYPYLFSYFSGEEWRTQEIVQGLMASNFTTATNGIPGNDDAGALSAWYVFSAMGLYPDNPVSGRYSLGSPLFDRIEIALQPAFYPTAVDNKFVINVQRSATNEIYFQQVSVNNGAASSNLFLNHDTIVNGGSLDINASATH